MDFNLLCDICITWLHESSETPCLWSQFITQCVKASLRLFMFGCEQVLCCSFHLCYTSYLLTTMAWFYPQGSESESVNGPGRDSGLASSRLDPSATLPSRGGADSEPETMEGILCRKQEMESHNKKAATRYEIKCFHLVVFKGKVHFFQPGLHF